MPPAHRTDSGIGPRRRKNGQHSIGTSGPARPAAHDQTHLVPGHTDLARRLFRVLRSVPDRLRRPWPHQGGSASPPTRSASSTSFFGVAGIGTFVVALFAGLFVGTIFFGYVADRYGRRTVFTFSLLWYSVSHGDHGVPDHRLRRRSLALHRRHRHRRGAGDYRHLRLRAGARTHARPRLRLSTSSSSSSLVPVVAFLAYLLVPAAPFGFDGWRWVVLIGSAGAIVVWCIRLACRNRRAGLPTTARMNEAERVIAADREPACAAEPAARCRRRHARGGAEEAAAAASPKSGSPPYRRPHHHAVGVQLLPDLRLLRLRQLGAARC